jgi:hypothetical protein
MPDKPGRDKPGPEKPGPETTAGYTDARIAVWRIFGTIDFFGTAGAPMPAAHDSLARAVAEGAPRLPSFYAAPFVTPLQARLTDLVGLAARGEIHPGSLEMLAGAIYQHGDEAPLASELRRFTAVVSDLFRSFLEAEARSGIGLPLTERLPPLAMFSHDGSTGPTTIAVDLVARFVGGAVAVVSLPATFAAHPILWAALAHETGGHDVIHADPGLLDELAACLPAALAGVPPAGTLTTDDSVALWRYWIDEAAADVYGLLNVGPGFAENLGLFLAAMNGGEHPFLRMENLADPDDPALMLDPHPPDILRLHLAIGVIESLDGLAAASRAAYAARIASMAQTFGNGAVVSLSGNIPGPDGVLRMLQAEAPLAPMQDAARAVGRYIATTRLASLGGHGIQDIESWDDADEAVVQRIRADFAAGRSVDHMGDDAQLLAAATLAVIDDPASYDRVTILLNAALDASFAADPLWSPCVISPAVAPATG